MVDMVIWKIQYTVLLLQMLNDILKLNLGQLQWMCNWSDFTPIVTSIPNLTLTVSREIPRNICDSCNMQVWKACPPGHLVPSLFGTCIFSKCWDQFSLAALIFRIFRFEYPSVLSRLTCYLSLKSLQHVWCVFLFCTDTEPVCKAIQ